MNKYLIMNYIKNPSISSSTAKTKYKIVFLGDQTVGKSSII